MEISVLVMMGYAGLRQVAQLFIRKRGWECYVTRDAAEAQAKFQNMPGITVVIADPNAEGLRLLASIKKEVQEREGIFLFHGDLLLNSRRAELEATGHPMFDLDVDLPVVLDQVEALFPRQERPVHLEQHPEANP